MRAKEYKNVEDIIHKINKTIQLKNISARIFKIEEETKSSGHYSSTTRILYRIAEELATSG